MATTTNNAHKTLDEYRLWGLVDTTGPEIKMWRATNIVTDYGDARVVAYDSGGASAAPVFKNAAALADGLANPTVGGVGAFIQGRNSAGTWDLIRTGAFTPAVAATGVLNTLGLSIYNSTLPTYTNGQFGTPQMGSRGGLHVNLVDVDGTSGVRAAAAGDGQASAVGLLTTSRLQGYNGTTFDQLRTVAANANPGGTTGFLGFNHVFSDGTSAFARSISASGIGDASTGANFGPVGLWGYNGASFDRLKSVNTGQLRVTLYDAAGENPDATAWPYNSDGVASAAVFGLATISSLVGYNGATHDRVRTVGTGRLSVEHSYTLGRATADTQIKASAGFVHTVSIAPLTATPTAGLLTVYDSASESGTVIYSEWIFATTSGHTVTLDVVCGTGIYVGFDATLANVQVTVSYR